MKNNIIDEVEKKCEINLDWFYHSTRYDKIKYTSILNYGVKCNKLLNNLYGGTYNGIYYISLSKITIPDNECFGYYASKYPSLIINGINPIKCDESAEYDNYIYTEDTRRTGIDGEYQYYYFIEKIYIKGIVWNLYDNFIRNGNKKNLNDLLELISLLEKFNISIPIYDYSRRDKVFAHEINKEKIKHYSKKPQMRF